MSPASALHIKQDDNHTVCINSLRVILSQDGDMWGAQGIDIDYAACGSSLEDVQQRFERGFARTIKLHLKKFGEIDRLLKMAPTSEWLHMTDADTKAFNLDLIATHEIHDMDGIPFKDIAYLQAHAIR